MSKPSLPVEQRSFTLEDLRLIAALRSAGSLAGAARNLSVNHASAWRRLGTLEARLSVRLFERTRSGYTATPAGDEAIAMAERVLHEIDETARRLTGQDVRLSGTVRLTTTESLLGFVAPSLGTLRDRHPGLVVEVITTNTFYTLTRRDADIALRPAAKPPEDLVAKRLAKIRTAVYATRDYARKGRRTPPLDLDWLSPDDSLAHLQSTRWIAKHVDPAHVVHRANSLISLREAARAGLGLAPLPCFLGDAGSGLVRVMPPIEEMATNLWLLVHPDLRRMPRVRVVMDTIVSYVAEHRHTLEASRASSS